ncbi:MAG TPA: nucleotidyltransferase family protein [Planctomycetaceae bacterium]|jgi:NDP-sugar pyrophosphorylase family protein|nr:nucleotidyltransferase family protein [Planctomycetaceae bacterium]
MSDVTGAILAGGLGTRLRSVVSDRPKVLAPVHGKPFLAHLLDQLQEAGVERVVLMTGYRGEQIAEAFGDRYRNLSLSYSVETEPLGTAGALRLALPKLFPASFSALKLTPDSGRRTPHAVLVLNGDSYCDAELMQFRAFHEQERADGSLVLAHVADTSRFGKVETTTGQRLERFLEKQEAGGPGSINAGIYLLNRELIAEIPAGRAVSIEREMFPAWLRTRRLLGYPAEGAFLDIGTPESYRAAEDFFARLAA